MWLRRQPIGMILASQETPWTAKNLQNLGRSQAAFSLTNFRSFACWFLDLGLLKLQIWYTTDLHRRLLPSFFYLFEAALDNNEGMLQEKKITSVGLTKRLRDQHRSLAGVFIPNTYRNKNGGQQWRYKNKSYRPEWSQCLWIYSVSMNLLSCNLIKISDANNNLAHDKNIISNTI